MTVGNVVLLSQKCAWAPNRAVTLAVHSYWVGKLQRMGRPACFQKAAAAFPAGGGSPQGLTRSFSASPVVGSSVLGGPPLFNPTSSGLSDMSAMTLEDLALSKVCATDSTDASVSLDAVHRSRKADMPDSAVTCRLWLAQMADSLHSLIVIATLGPKEQTALLVPKPSPWSQRVAPWARLLDGWLVCLQQRRATSETSEDTQALQGLSGDAAALPGSLGFAATATPSPLSMAQVEQHSASATRAMLSSSPF